MTLYEHGNFGGAALRLSGVEIEQSVSNNVNWNDRVSSYKIADNVKLTLCKHGNCDNDPNNDNVSEAFGPLEVSWVGKQNDQYSTVIIEPFKGGAVALFEDIGCNGNSRVAYHGDYPFAAFTKLMTNDKLSGIIVAKDTTAYLYQHGNYAGWAKTIVGPAKHCDLTKLAGTKNDDASAMKVRAKNGAHELKGQKIEIVLYQLDQALISR